MGFFGRASRRVAAATLAAMLLIGPATPALAAFSAAPDDTWMTNGTVYAVVRAGNYVYIGGKFTRAFENPPGQTGAKHASSGIVRFNADTGLVDKSWKVQVRNSDGTRATVYSIAVVGGKVFFGGAFDLVNGQPRSNLAAVSESDGALDLQIDPVMNNIVRSMVAGPSTVYVGGYFTTVDGLARRHLAAFDSAGTLLSWRPRTASGSVRSLILDCSGTRVYAGGQFALAAGPTGTFVPRDSIARFSATTGALDAWSTRDSEIGNGSIAFDLALSCASQELFVGIGGQNFLYAFDVSDDDGEALWIRQTAGNVQTVAVNDMGTADVGDDRVLFGGHFGGGVTYPSGTCSQAKPKTAKFGVATLDGNCDLTWWPTFEGNFFGPWDILVTDNGDRVWVGGQFTQVCDGNSSTCASQYYIARFTNV